MPKSEFVHANGIRIHYLREGSGPPLVLLHGWPEFSGVWEQCIALLASHFEVIAPDLRGFGDTDKPYDGPSTAMTPDVLADDLAGLLDALSISERVGVVAHDVGAYAAQTFARNHAERLAGLFLFNCPHPGIGRRWIEADHVPEIWYQTFNCLPWTAEMVGSSRDACRLFIGHFLRHWAAEDHVFDKDLERFVDNFMKPGNLQGGFNWYSSIREVRRAQMKGEAVPLAPIEAPTRVFWGERDPVLKAEWMDNLSDTFANLQADVAPGVGHFVHYEDPERAAGEITRFFTGLRARA